MASQSTFAVQRPLHVLMVAPTSFFSDYGGHIRILEETRTLQGLGHQVTIVTYHKGSDLPGLDIRRTRALPYHADYEVGSSRHKVAFDLYLTAQTLVEGWRTKPDIIHGHMHEGALIGGLLARIQRIPLVFDFQGSLTSEMVDHAFLNPKGRIFPWILRLERFITRLPQAILTSSLQAHDLLRNQFNVPDERIYPLPDCVDTTTFDPAQFPASEREALRQQLGIPAGRPVVVYLGLLTDYQGIPQLIESAACLKQAGEAAHFLIMGFPDVDRYKGLARRAGVLDLMTFTGKIEYRHAARYLSLGNVAVAPKISATEGSGKLLNYMALGQPVVAYDTPVHREYLAEWGCYVPAGNTAAFAATIARLLHAPQRRLELGQRLRQRAMTTYSWQRAGERIVAIYQRLLTGKV